MMRNAAFVLLKTGLAGPKSTQQAEIRLAVLLKILPTAGSTARLATIGKEAPNGRF
jgi:hypothetical protein